MPHIRGTPLLGRGQRLRMNDPFVRSAGGGEPSSDVTGRSERLKLPHPRGQGDNPAEENTTRTRRVQT